MHYFGAVWLLVAGALACCPVALNLPSFLIVVLVQVVEPHAHAGRAARVALSFGANRFRVRSQPSSSAHICRSRPSLLLSLSCPFSPRLLHRLTSPELVVEAQLLRVSGGVPQHGIPGANAEWPQGSTLYRKNKFVPPCDITAQNGICLFSGKRAIVAPAVPGGTVAVFSFDELIDSMVVDGSGNGNHGALVNRLAAAAGADGKAPAAPAPAKLATGPGRAGRGSSGRFDSKTYVRIPSSNSIASMGKKGFSASFWLFLANEHVGAPIGGCPLFALGENVLSVLPGHKLSVSFKGQPVVSSEGTLTAFKWTHVTLSHGSDSGMLSLYINGVRDLHLRVPIETEMRPEVYIGGGVAAAQCSAMDVLIDDVRLTDRPSEPSLVGSESFPVMGSVEPGYCTVGCSREAPCLWESARRTCAPRYHLCSTSEMQGGAYALARTQGWITWDDAVWVAEDARAKPADTTNKKVALCCAFDSGA